MSGLYKPLSNFDLLGQIAKDMNMRGNIVDTRELLPTDNVEKIFAGRGHAILYEPSNDPNSDVGHWTCLIRTSKGDCIYFDSYGDKIPNERLKKILKKKYPIIQFNPFQFQSENTSVCGRYALICVGLNKLIPNINVINLIDFFKSKPAKETYDKFVYNITKEV